MIAQGRPLAGVVRALGLVGLVAFGHLVIRRLRAAKAASGELLAALAGRCPTDNGY